MPPRRRAAAPAPAPASSARRQAPANAAETSRRRPGRASPPSGPVVTLRRLFAVAAVVVLTAGYTAARLAGQAYVQSLFADFEPGEATAVSPLDAEVHSSLFVVDLHCDASFSKRCVPGTTASSHCVFPPRSCARLLTPAPPCASRNQQSAGPGGPERVRHMALRALSRGRASPGGWQRRAPGAWTHNTTHTFCASSRLPSSRPPCVTWPGVHLLHQRAVRPRLPRPIAPVPRRAGACHAHVA